ncbi:MAG: hypothetical protein KAW12_20855 [Candidatus Aminicenantes bacterium]|nr:hypothetical protein [Candidatus Aminicenantes bacterium]
MKNRKTLKPVFATWKRKKYQHKEVFLKIEMIRRKKCMKEKTIFLSVILIFFAFIGTGLAQTGYTTSAAFSDICDDENSCEKITNNNISYLDSWCINNPYFFNQNHVACWKSSHGNPFVSFIESVSGNQYSEFQKDATMTANDNGTGTGVYQDVSISSGRIYVLTYKYQVKNAKCFVGGSNNYFPTVSNFGILDNFYVKFVNKSSSFTPPHYGNVFETPPTPISYQLIDQLENISAGGVITKTVCIEANANYNAIWFYPKQDSSNATNNSRIRLVKANMYEVGAGNDANFGCTGTTTLGYGCATAGVSFSWSPSTGLSATNILNPTVNASSLSNGSHTYTLTVNTPCGSTLTDDVTINVTGLNIALTANQNPICKEDWVTLTASGAWTYTWTPNPITLEGVNGSPKVFQPTDTQQITVHGTDLNGCTGTASLTIYVVSADPNWEYDTTHVTTGYVLTVHPATSTSSIHHQWTVYKTSSIYQNPIQVHNEWGAGSHQLNYTFQYDKYYMVKHGVYSWNSSPCSWKEKRRYFHHSN